MLEAFARYLGATGSRRSHRAPRARAREQGGREGADRRAAHPGGRARREPQPARGVDRQGRGARGQGARRPRSASRRCWPARACARTGLNWRDAVPFYEKVLALDPDNVAATLAKVELYDEAGLHDTAQALLDRALVTPAAERGAPARERGVAARSRAARPRPTSWRSATSRVRFDDPGLRARAGRAGHRPARPRERVALARPHQRRPTPTARAPCRRRRRPGCAWATGPAPSRPTAPRSISRPTTPT